jgi:hypothetical protein
MGKPAAFIAARGHHGAAGAIVRGAPEFFGIVPLAAVGLFALNNFVLKRTWPGLVTRVAAGIALTATIFIAVKTSVTASRMLDGDIAMLLQPLGIRSNPNRVDVTDLFALPMLALAWYHARRAVFAGPRPSGQTAR